MRTFGRRTHYKVRKIHFQCSQVKVSHIQQRMCCWNGVGANPHKQCRWEMSDVQQNLETYTVCVLIPSYNAGELVERCLHSLIAQTYENWRAIVVDDGSQDDTRNRIDQFAKVDERITWYGMDHGGASVARNLALEKAAQCSPQYITFLDADDYLEPEALQAMLDRALETGADIVHCKYFSDYTSGYQYILRDLFPVGSVFSSNEFPKTVYWKMITGIQMNHVCTKLYRAELFQSVRFSTDMATGEDLLANMDLFSRAGSYAYLERPLYHYIRDTAGGLTGSGISLRIKFLCNWRISQEMLHRLPQWGMDTLWIRIWVVGRPISLLISKSIRAFIGKAGKLRQRW